MHIFAQCVDDDGASGNRQHIFTRGGHLLGEVHQHVVTHVIHVGAPRLTRRGVGQLGLLAVFHLAYHQRQGDGKVLEALHDALGRVDGDLLIERLGGDGNDEPERQRQQRLAVHDEGRLGNVQEIVTGNGKALLKVNEHGLAVGIEAHGALNGGAATLLQRGDRIILDRDGQVGKGDGEVLQAGHVTLGRRDLHHIIRVNYGQCRCAIAHSHDQHGEQ